MGQILENIKIEKIIYKGVGLASLPSGKKIMVEGNPLPNSIVNAQITKKKRDFLIAKVVETKEYDSSIVEKQVMCPHYKNPIQKQNKENTSCGGCKRQVIKYEEQLKLKENIVLDSFRQKQQILEKTTILPIQKAPKQYHYRNKVEYSFGKSDTNDWQLGFHASGSFQNIVDVQQCYLVSLKAYQVFAIIKEILQKSGLSTYKQKDHSGVLRHLVVREGYNTGQILVNLVYAEKNLSENQQATRNQTLEKIQKNEKLKELVTTMLLTINNGLGDAINPNLDQSILRGDGFIYEKLQDNRKDEDEQQPKTMILEEGVIKESKIKNTKNIESNNQSQESIFKISPFSFFQTNTHGAEHMIKIIESFLANYKVDTLLDLYCGTGTLGLSLLKKGIGKNLIGIEIIEDAIKDARHNAQINNIDGQVYFSAGKAEELVYKDQYIQEHIKDINTIIVDPPRSGLHKKVISFLSNLKKQIDFTLIYISCNPTTLSRDCHLLSQSNFQMQTLQALDMFPQTYHIETITLLK